jgi:hypothetical protein
MPGECPFVTGDVSRRRGCPFAGKEIIMTALYSRTRPPSVRALRVETLLDRYPRLSGQELAELISLYRALNFLEQELLIADSGLSAKLVAFRRHHGSKLRSGLWSLIMFVSVPLVAIAAAWLVLG